MSLFYNRDRNITGAVPLASFEFDPNYGSSIAFSCKNNKIAYNDNTYSLVASTLNNIVGNCSFSFTVGTGDAQKMTNFFESQSGTGYFAISDSSQIYRPLNGFANSFGISMQGNNLYNINLTFSVERNSSFLDWKGMSFVNYDFKTWGTGIYYEKYQPVYFETQKDSLIKNFFYAKESHTGSYDKVPTNESYWTQDFFYENDFGLNVDTEPTIDYLNFKNSFTQRIKSQDNIHSFKKLDLSYKNISDFKLKSMLHFLESHLGYMKFRFDCPQIYNRPKIFYAETWSHSWNYKDSNNLTVTLMEDPLGILNQIDTPNVSLYQTSSAAQITGQASASDGLFLVDYSGKKIATQNGVFGASPTSKTTKFYQDLNLLSASDQKINKISFGQRVNLETGLFTGNSLANINFNGARDVQYLDLRNNSIPNFNSDGVTGLKYLNLSGNSSLTGISVSQCNQLTGILLSGTNLTSSSFSGLLNTISTGNGLSGTIVCPKNVSGNKNLLLHVSNLDYKDWTQQYNDLILPFEPTGFVDAGVNTFWYKNSQARETGNEYFLNWKSSRTPNTISQAYSPAPEKWFSPQAFEIGQRSTFKFNETFLSGSGYGNTGDYLAAFLIAKVNSTSDMCLMNFSPNEPYGIYQQDGVLCFLGKSRSYVFRSTPLSLGRYYSIGFWRDTNYFNGFLNGDSQRGEISAIKSDLSSIVPCIGGSGKNANDYFFDGNIAEALVYSSNSPFSLDPKFHYNFNSRFIITGAP
jgi:hypothetical protein